MLRTLFCIFAVAHGSSILEFKGDNNDACKLSMVNGALESECNLVMKGDSMGLAEVQMTNQMVTQLQSFQKYLKVKCPTLTANTGVNLSGLNDAVTGDERKATCLAGYHPATADFGCYIDGFHGTQPTCNPYKCPEETLTIQDAQGTVKGSLHFPETINARVNGQHTHTRTCPASHTGSVTRTCGVDAETWTHSGSCIEKVCPAINVNIGGTNINFAQQRQSTGHSSSKSCPTHYTGNVRVHCAAGASSFTVDHNCARKCYAFGASGNANGCSETTEGNTCTQQCNSGYTGSSTTRTCGSDGNWAGSSPSCAVTTTWSSVSQDNGLWLHGYLEGNYKTSAVSNAQECKNFADNNGYTWTMMYSVWAGSHYTCWAGSTKGYFIGLNWGHGSWQKTGRRLVEADSAVAAVESKVDRVEELRALARETTDEDTLGALKVIASLHNVDLGL